MNEQNVASVTGMSGVGRTTAMSILGGMGCHCIDNFSVQLLGSLGRIINAKSDPCHSNTALATIAIDYPKFLQYSENIDVNVHVIFLDASNEKLLLCYKFIRRHHLMVMFSRANTLGEATKVERDMFNALNECAVLHIGTTMMDQHGLKNVPMEKLLLNSEPVFSIPFISSDLKHGVPIDVDPVFDVRFLLNPYYIERLREQTGDGASVYDYVMSFDRTKESIRHLKSSLDYVLIQYKNEKKNHLIVRIGCTEGHHQSVSVTNWLYSHYRDRHHRYKSHRDRKTG